MTTNDAEPTDIGVGFAQCLTSGSAARQVSSTSANDRSSRSHAILSVMLESVRSGSPRSTPHDGMVTGGMGAGRLGSLRRRLRRMTGPDSVLFPFLFVVLGCSFFFSYDLVFFFFFLSVCVRCPFFLFLLGFPQSEPGVGTILPEGQTGNALIHSCSLWT